MKCPFILFGGLRFQFIWEKWVSCAKWFGNPCSRAYVEDQLAKILYN